MAQFNGKQQRRVTIRSRMARIVYVTTLVALVAASVTGIFCIRWIRNASEDAMIRQLETNLKGIVQQKAVVADAKLEHYGKYIEFIRDYIELMYTNEASMIARGRIFDPPRDTDAYELTRGLATEDLFVADFEDQMRFFSNLEHIWEPITRENEGLITTLYVGSKEGLLTSYDRWSFLSAVPEGEEFYYNYFEADWFTQGVQAKDVFYTGLYTDSQGRGLTITVASPFRNVDGEVMGVECADFDITGLYDELISLDLGEGSFSFALDADGAILSPEAEAASFEAITGLTPEALGLLLKEEDGILERDDAVYVCIPIERVGWTLCACVPKEVILSGIHGADRSIGYAMGCFAGIAALIFALALVAVNRAARTVTEPMEQIERDMQVISDGDLNYRATVRRNDEIGDIASRMNEMIDRLNFTMNELRATRQRADAMSELAIRDPLTGLRNSTAYEDAVCALEQALAAGEGVFGLVMIDLNNLKVVNDTFGHEKGDIAIKTLSKIICGVFVHSPVYRVGGDEFVVVLQNADYRNIKALIEDFNAEIDAASSDDQLEPWERTSAAIGYALYDPARDGSVSDVLARADQAMYHRKREMKGQ